MGKYQPLGLSVCPDSGTNATAPLVSTPTNLGEDLYVSTTYVDDRAGIALDIKQMEDMLTTNRKDLAEGIYLEGENSPVYDNLGMEIDIRSVSSFSTKAGNTMRNNPMFQVAVHALQDGLGFYKGKAATSYADTVVNEAFSIGGSSTLAAEAAVSLNLWMEIVNELYQTVAQCKAGTIVDEDGVRSIDEAAAYWIGDGQVAGDAERGHLLYALAEKMANVFGSTDVSGQASANVNILRLFHEAKIELSFPDSCTTNLNTVKRMRHIVNRIITQMLIVNLQALIDALRVEDRQRVMVYAHGYVPFLEVCSPKNFQYLRAKILNDAYLETEVETIIQVLRDTFPCFDIKCADIGKHKSSEQSMCEDPSPLDSMAGFHPSSDMRQMSQLDHDIQELDILMQMESYSAAEDLYEYGHHASTGLDEGRVSLSLEYLATNSGRSAVPQFDAFKRFFGDDDRYADTIIRRAFDLSQSMTPLERRITVVGTAQYMVLFMAALQSIEDAVRQCDPTGKGENGRVAILDWDTVAAFTIGAMEGRNDGGSNEGRLLWALAKEHCAEFGTCSSLVVNSASVNDRILSLLYTGRGALMSGSCKAMRKAADELVPLLQVPIIQAALSSMTKLAETRSSSEQELHWVQARVYSNALLPLIDNASREAATVIRENVDANGDPMSDGLPKVASAFTSVLKEMEIDCTDVGNSKYVDSCTGSVKSNGDRTGMIVGIVVGAIAAIGIVMILRAKTRAKQLEEKPTFIAPKGELNHVSDLIPSPEGTPRSGGDDDLQALNDADTASDEDGSGDDERSKLDVV